MKPEFIPELDDRPCRIVMIEDTPEDAELAAHALRSCEINLTIEIATDGDRALELLGLATGSASPTKRPDLIICDVKLPKRRGPEILRIAKNAAHLVGVPFVMFSNSSLEVDVRECMLRGANEYCVKPMLPKDYAECVLSIVRKWLGTEGQAAKPSCEIDCSDKPPA